MAATPPSLFAIEQEPISSSRVILCEGGGDKNFFESLIRERELPEFYVTHPRDKIDDGGRRGFAQRLRGLRLQQGFDMVTGVIVVSDNDRNPNASFQEVRNLIHEAEYKAPNRPFVVAPGSPSVVVMMIPSENENGQLETLCLRAIANAWPDKYVCAEKYAKCIGIDKWTNENKQERATLRALVSHLCQKDPNTSLSHLWHDGREVVIPLKSDHFTAIADFLSGFDALITPL
jgi:hypothetical protein